MRVRATRENKKNHTYHLPFRPLLLGLGDGISAMELTILVLILIHGPRVAKTQTTLMPPPAYTT
jgi:hypothetical protein